MVRAALLLVFIVGCRFDLPEEVGCLSDKYESLPGGTAGHVYLRGTTVELWETAKGACGFTGPRAYLAVPDDAGELTALRTRAGNTFWTGVHDQITEGMFVRMPMDTLATFLPWSAGEPDNPGEQDCVAATSTTISTEECFVDPRVYICECEP